MTDQPPYPMVIYGDVAFVVLPLPELRYVAESVKIRLKDLGGPTSGLVHDARSRRLAGFAEHVLEVVPSGSPPVKPAGRPATTPTPPAHPAPTLLTAGAAEHLVSRGIHLTDSRIRQLARSREIAARQDGRVWLFDPADLDRYAAARTAVDGNRPSPSTEMGAS